ncbi:MAG TPA: putative Ig domain-containing protein [Thermoanaerobaculia bacterium]|nr:putative Ig domain-containing protein [Thermoanaerobaculia bacterium]
MRKYLLLAVLVLCAAPAFGQCLLTFQTEVIPVFFVGQAAHFQVEGVSGTEPYNFEVNLTQPGSQPMPAGLKLHKNGKITGVPQVEGENLVYITLSDAAGCNLTQAFNISVFP